MNSKEIPAERPTNRGNRRSRSNNNNDAATSNNSRAVNHDHDFMNMFAQMELRHRLEMSPPMHISSRIPRASSPITTTTPRFPVLRAPFTGFLRESFRPTYYRPTSAADWTPRTPPEDAGNSGPADDVSYGSLPSLVTRPDSTDDESEDDEAGEVMSYGSLPSLAARVDSSDEEDDDDSDDSSLPSLLSRSDSSDDDDSTVGSFPPLLRRRRINAVSIPPMARRGDSTDSDDDSDGDSDCSSDDSSASDGQTYCEATEIERETSEYYFDNEVVIDRGPSGITRSQRRINRLSGPTSIRRNLSRVRCRCLARMTNNDAWIKLRDTMSVGRAVQ